MKSEAFNLADIADISNSIIVHKRLPAYITQLDPSQSDTLKEIHEMLLQRSGDKKYIDHIANEAWEEVNIHYIYQMWGSTSCGWEGIGGAAMTESRTLILESVNFDLVSVYYGGRLAYIVRKNEKLNPFRSNGWKNLPGCQTVKSVLDVLYRSRK